MRCARDNDDLRQFSLDGYEIAKGAQQLSDDRERLTADLKAKNR
jgi:cytochrome c-type biogenesis protein CcmH/NrfF